MASSLAASSLDNDAVVWLMWHDESAKGGIDQSDKTGDWKQKGFLAITGELHKNRPEDQKH